MAETRNSFLRRLQEIAQAHAQEPAVLTGAQVLTYSQLWSAASEVGICLSAQGVRPGDRVAILGHRTIHDFVHLLGIWLAGGAYVPLNHKFPVSRNREICTAAGARGVLVGPTSGALSDQLAAGCAPAVPLAGIGSSYRPVLQADAAPRQATEEAAADLAYILFTSGTTGAPKGVPISFDNLAAYLGNLQALYPVGSEDRMAQLADLSFDASIHEIAWCWWTGGALCVVPASSSLLWPRYAQELRASIALLVPSSVILAARARLLGRQTLPDMRLVFLGAEAVSARVVGKMQEAAPNATLVNLWGPTETTVAFTHFRIDTTRALPELIPIGRPFPGESVQLWDEDGNVVARGSPGELVQSGRQVMHGYWRSSQLNAQRFADRDGRRWFRSGDLAVEDDACGLRYLGRVDRQVKIRGYRVELIECESAIRSATGCDQVAVVPVLPEGEHVAQGLACFLAGEAVDFESLKSALKNRLADYMIPSRFEQVDALPLGPTGKVDYAALQRRVRP